MKVRTHIRAGKGLGDHVADLTRATGLDSLAHAYTHVTGRDCGCDGRRRALNQLVPRLTRGDQPGA